MKIREAHRYTLEGEYVDSFKSLTEAREKTGVSIAVLSKCLYGENKTAKGYQWLENKVKKTKPFKREFPKFNISIHQYTLEGHYIREFNTYNEIAETLNISRTQAGNTKRCCEGKAKTVAGFQWEYIKVKKIRSVVGNIYGTQNLI